MDTERFGLELKKLREERGLTIRKVASNVHLSPSRISQLERADEVIKDEVKIKKNIDALALYFSENKIISINERQTKEEIKNKLEDALYYDKRVISREEVKEYLGKILEHFKKHKDNNFSNGYDELITHIKTNFSEYFFTKETVKELSNLVGLYTCYEYELNSDLITERYIHIYHDEQRIKVDKICPHEYKNYSYNVDLSMVRKRDDVIYLDLEEIGGIERLRIVISSPFGAVKVLTGITSELTINKEPLARYILLVKEDIKELEVQKRKVDEYKRHEMKRYTEYEFKNKSSEHEIYLNFLKDVNNNKLIAKRFANYMTNPKEIDNLYYGFCLSNHEKEKPIAISTLQIREIIENNKIIFKIRAKISENYELTIQEVISTDNTIIFQSNTITITLEKIPSFPSELKDTHNVLYGVLTYYSTVYKRIFSSKILFIRANVDLEKKDIHITKKQYITSIYDEMCKETGRISFEKFNNFIEEIVKNNKVFIPSINKSKDRTYIKNKIESIKAHIKQCLHIDIVEKSDNDKNTVDFMLRISKFANFDILNNPF